jgi:hypothetical protein
MTALSGPPNLQSAKRREQTRLSSSFVVSVDVMRNWEKSLRPMRAVQRLRAPAKQRRAADN